MNDVPKRGVLSFSIRDLLWLTAIVAVVLWAIYGKPQAAPPPAALPGRFIINPWSSLWDDFFDGIIHIQSLRIALVDRERFRILRWARASKNLLARIATRRPAAEENYAHCRHDYNP